MIQSILKSVLVSGCLSAGLCGLALADEPARAAFDWTGFYAGVHGGYGWSRFDDEFAAAVGYGEGFKPKGWLGGAQVGGNYQFPSRVVLGLEADAAYVDAQSDHDETTDIDPTTTLQTYLATKIDGYGSLRARAGYAVDRFLPYVTGGVAWGRESISYDYNITTEGLPFSDTRGSDHHWKAGWVVGAGVEYAIGDHLTAKAEYLYTDLGSQHFDLGIGDPEFVQDIILQSARAGLNYKF